MPAALNRSTLRPGDVRRRALEDLLGRIDVILAELDEGAGPARDDMALPAALTPAS